jgi:hypothetical protein
MTKAEEEKNTAEQQSHLKTEEHTTLVGKYHEDSRTCCTEINDMRSELCALRKIRGELKNLDDIANKDIIIRDCTLTEWEVHTCSVTCGEGTQTKTREIVQVQSELGVKCPPLAMTMRCWDHYSGCPIDCHMSSWSEWSACSSDCGGGQKTKTRDINREARYDGLPCTDTSTSQPCNEQACDRDCVLNDWSDWSVCDKQCGEGVEERRRSIREDAVGNGYCAHQDDPTRADTVACYLKVCEDVCVDHACTCSKTDRKKDVVFLLDESSSINWSPHTDGWANIVESVSKIITKMSENDQAAVMRFSGRYKSWDLEHLGELWINPAGENFPYFTPHSKFTDLSAAVLERKDKFQESTASLGQDKFGSTWTHTAVYQARDFFNKKARADAADVLVIFTDGKPTYKHRLKDALKALEERNSDTIVVWVILGSIAEDEFFKRILQWPRESHRIEIPDFDVNGLNKINEIVSRLCTNIF